MIRFLCLTMLLLAGCQREPKERNRCLELPAGAGPEIAKIGDQSLTTSYLEQRLREQGPDAEARYADGARLKRFVEDQIRFELLVQAAKERGLDKDPDVVDAARKVMVRKLLLQDLGTQALAEDPSSDEEVTAYYNAHIEEFQQPAQRRVLHIQLAPTPEGVAQAHNLIELLQKNDDPAHRLFKERALKESLDQASRLRGGELSGFVSQDAVTRDFGPSFGASVFALKVGEIARAPVQSTRGWHVVLVLMEKPALLRTLAEARAEIQDKLLSSRRSALFDKYVREIRQRHPVALYEEMLPSLSQKLAGAESKP